jgi:hypothetical protein
MAIISFDSEDRRVVPNWRRLEKTVRLGELGSIGNETVQTFSFEDIKSNVIAWRNNTTIGHAGDLISSAFVTDQIDYPDVKEAAKFIISLKDSAPDTLTKIANKIISDVDEDEPYLDVKSIDELERIHNTKYIEDRISILKKSINRLPRNSIKRVELARLYSLLGQYEPASQSMKIGLNLAPNNRFILRSAARLFVHLGEYELAHAPLRNSDATKYDPWLISSEIAIASIRERHSRFAKEGFKTIKSDNYSKFNISELSSSLATLELYNGAHKDAKKLFRNSLIDPNDNAYAQYKWASNHDKRLLGFSPKDKVPNPFEALAIENYHNGNWVEALNHIVNWFLDIPYSKRPVVLGSFIALTYLEKYELAIKLCEAGLHANPNHPTIVNNLAYSVASNGNPDKALKILNDFKSVGFSKANDGQRISLIATEGLIFFRLSMYEVGREKYNKAINEAEEKGSEYYRSLAFLNLLKEELRLSSTISRSNELKSKVDQYVSDSSNKHIKWLKNKILKDYIR